MMKKTSVPMKPAAKPMPAKAAPKTHHGANLGKWLHPPKKK
jgi:hypothetical protein